MQSLQFEPLLKPGEDESHFYTCKIPTTNIYGICPAESWVVKLRSNSRKANCRFSTPSGRRNFIDILTISLRASGIELSCIGNRILDHFFLRLHLSDFLSSESTADLGQSHPRPDPDSFEDFLSSANADPHLIGPLSRAGYEDGDFKAVEREDNLINLINQIR